MLVPLIVSFWAMDFRCRWLQLVMDHWGSGSDGSGASTRPAVGSEGGGPRCSMCPRVCCQRLGGLGFNNRAWWIS